MKLEPFLLDHWLNQIEGAKSGERWDLASSTGPVMTLRDLLALDGEHASLSRLLETRLTYAPMQGSEQLRNAIAEIEGVEAGQVLVLTGAAEALLILFALAAEPGANIVLPKPDFPAMSAVARGFGLEVRHYVLDPAMEFRLDPEVVASLCDADTQMVVVISPHNPSGAVVVAEEMRWLHDFCVRRGVPLICDQVYHPIYYGTPQTTAASLPGTTVLGDCSKALCLSGLRVGWMVERSPGRLERQLDARGYFTISNNVLGEALAVCAIRHRDRILERARHVGRENLRLLDDFFARHRDRFGWVRPKGGFTAFPWLLDGTDSYPMCRALLDEGVGVVPGVCMDAPAHFRLGFGANAERFADGLEAFDRFLNS